MISEHSVEGQASRSDARYLSICHCDKDSMTYPAAFAARRRSLKLNMSLEQQITPDTGLALTGRGRPHNGKCLIFHGRSEKNFLRSAIFSSGFNESPASLAISSESDDAPPPTKKIGASRQSSPDDHVF